MKKTEDIPITSADGWKLVEVAKERAYLTEVRNGEGYYRFGSDSVSLGTKITEDEVVVFDESFYVRAKGSECVITVTKEV